MLHTINILLVKIKQYPLRNFTDVENLVFCLPIDLEYFCVYLSRNNFDRNKSVRGSIHVLLFYNQISNIFYPS